MIAIKAIEITVAIAKEIIILEMHQKSKDLCLRKPSKQQGNLLSSSFSNIFNSSTLLIFSISPSSTLEMESHSDTFELFAFLSFFFKPKVKLLT
jgi:hypothetical protein